MSEWSKKATESGSKEYLQCEETEQGLKCEVIKPAKEIWQMTSEEYISQFYNRKPALSKAQIQEIDKSKGHPRKWKVLKEKYAGLFSDFSLYASEYLQTGKIRVIESMPLEEYNHRFREWWNAIETAMTEGKAVPDDIKKAFLFKKMYRQIPRDSGDKL